jgi:MFS family permease
MAAAQLFCEVPSGIASDRLGRKKTLIVAASARLVAWLLIGLSSSTVGFSFSVQPLPLNREQIAHFYLILFASETNRIDMGTLRRAPIS